jgi:hypothetical protein
VVVVVVVVQKLSETKPLYTRALRGAGVLVLLRGAAGRSSRFMDGKFLGNAAGFFRSPCDFDKKKE